MNICTVQDVSQLGTILGIWAHPDDESFTCAGILGAAVQNGQRVVCITATKGEAGVQDALRWPPEKLGEIRMAELEDALQILGISEHHWLSCGDGKCGQANQSEVVERIKEIVNDVRPDTILTFGPDGLTGHPDHQAASAWAGQVAKDADWPITVYHAVTLREVYEKYLKEADKELNIYFMIDEPRLCKPEECDIAFRLPSELQAKKREALAAQPSQMEKMLQYFGMEGLEKAFSYEAFVKAPK